MKAIFRRLMRPVLELQVRRLIARHHLKVVAVGGSLGKTTTKAAITSVLSQKYRIFVHPGNYNDTMSIPLAAFGLDVPTSIINPFAWAKRLFLMESRIWGTFNYDVLVLELGTDHPGEIAHFMRYLTPDLGVVTGVAPEHMEFFGTIEAVADEEFTLAHGTKQAILNDTFDRLHPLAKGLKPAPIWYSDATCKPYRSQLAKAGRNWPVQIEQALGAAVVVAEAMKLNHAQIEAGLMAFTGVPGRMQQLDGQNGSLIIDDTYNAAPDSVVAALQYLDSFETTGRRIAILGSMNELGSGSADYHRQVGTAAGQSKLDALLTIGSLANDYLAPEAIEAGLDAAKVQTFDSPYAAGRALAGSLQPGDVVLAKGSQNGVFAEEAIKSILANPADAAKLVRQSPDWLAKKRTQFADARG